MLQGPIDYQAINDYSYGPAWSERWSTHFGVRPETAPCVEFLSRLAGAGPVVELAAGSGRVACPLAEQGHHVIALDRNADALAQARERSGGTVDTVTATLPDLGGVSDASLIYLVSWGINALLDHSDQRTLVAEVAEALAPGGVFVVDHMVPDVVHASSGHARVVRIDVGRTVLSTALYVPHDDMTLMSYVFLTDAAPPDVWCTASKAFSADTLRSWAHDAGLDEVAEYGSWSGSPVVPGNPFRIAVFRAPGAAGSPAGKVGS